MYYYVPKTGRFEQRARSVARSTFSVPRRAYEDEVVHLPFTPYSHRYGYGYDTTGNENYTRSQVNRNLLLSSAAMEDNFDISNRSRQRDREVITAANKAILSSNAATELFSSPRTAVAARRAMRGQSTPPGPIQSANISKTEVHVALARANQFDKLRASVPPASAPSRQQTRYPRVVVKPWYKLRQPVRYLVFYEPTYIRNLPSYEDSEIEGLRHAPRSMLAYLRNLEKKVLSKRTRAYSVPIRKASRKAALIGSKVDVTTPTRRRPKSAYAQAKLRQINLRSSSRDASPTGATAAVAAETSGLKAHKPVFVKTQAKPLQDVDGPRKPNILSWQYRIDAYTPPDDMVFVPRKLSSVKQQLLECKGRLDHHRQLMDRYLVTDTGMSVDDMRVVAASKAYLGSRA